uniref:Uncharacterized protein n=1 Tax=Anguilla anguilla TaxID=7936 RepID=A0A0E9TLK0_ANGAN
MADMIWSAAHPGSEISNDACRAIYISIPELTSGKALDQKKPKGVMGGPGFVGEISVHP